MTRFCVEADEHSVSVRTEQLMSCCVVRDMCTFYRNYNVIGGLGGY